MSRLEPITTPRSTLLAFAALAFTILTWGVTPVFVRSFALAVGPADSMRVVTLIEHGVQEAKTLTSDPKVQAEIAKIIQRVR